MHRMNKSCSLNIRNKTKPISKLEGLGKDFPHGIFVAQDDENLQNGKKLNLNFKMVPWEQIAKGTRIPLTIDDGINPRELVNRRTQ